MDEEFHPMEGEPQQKDAAEKQFPSLLNDGEIGRRQMIRAGAAGLLALAVGTSNTGKGAEKNSRLVAAATGKKEKLSPEEALDAAEKSVQEAGYLTVERGCDPNNDMEVALRGKAIVRPLKYKLTAAVISIHITSTGGGRVMLSCPREFCDQLPVGTQVILKQNGMEIPSNAKIIYSEGAKNPFLEVNIDSHVSGALTIDAIHWITQPDYPPVPNTEIARLLGPQTTAALGAALMKAANLPYDANVKRGDATAHLHGDCGVKADLACATFKQLLATQKGVTGDIKFAEGYSFLDPKIDPKFGGRHAINVMTTPKGLLTFDPRQPKKYSMVPQRGFIPTAVGDEHIIPGWNRGAPVKGTNGGGYNNSLVKLDEKASLSLPQISAPKEIEEYAKLRWLQNMEKYKATGRR